MSFSSRFYLVFILILFKFCQKKFDKIEIKLEIKVEKILKGSFDLISSPSPSVKIQIMGGKVCLRLTGKPLLGIVIKLFLFESLLTISSNILPLQLSHHLIFTKGVR